MTTCITNCCSQDTNGPDLQTAISQMFDFCKQWTDPNFVLPGTAPSTTATVTQSGAATTTRNGGQSPITTAGGGQGLTTVLVITTVIGNGGSGSGASSPVATKDTAASEFVLILWACLALFSVLAVFVQLR
jgi:hypothetical protein